MNKVMKIGNYQAIIDFDAEISLFRGEFIGLNGGADFYADSVAELQKEGHESLQAFLEMCVEDGVDTTMLDNKLVSKGAEMQLSNIKEIFNDMASLPIEDQCFIVDTLNNCIRDLRRNQIEIRGQQAVKNYAAGKTQSGNVADLMRAIDDD